MKGIFWKVYEYLIDKSATPAGGELSVGTHLWIGETGYTVPTAPIGLYESRELEHADPELVKRYLALEADYRVYHRRQLLVTHTYRSPEKQFELYQIGRELQNGVWVVVNPKIKVTNCDGTRQRSRHNFYPAQAIDVAIDTDPGVGQKVVWANEAYEALGPLALRHGLTWGGDWNRNGLSDEKWIDACHLEIA